MLLPGMGGGRWDEEGPWDFSRKKKAATLLGRQAPEPAPS